MKFLLVEVSREPKIHPRMSREHLDSHNGQDDYVIVARHPKTKEPMGALWYNEYKNKRHISMVKVLPKHARHGIGRKLIRHLAKDGGLKDVNPGYSTEQGGALLRSYKRHYPDG